MDSLGPPEAVALGMAPSAQDTCPPEEVDACHYVLASSSVEGFSFRHRPPFSRTFSVPALPSLIDSLSASLPGTGCRSEFHHANQTSVKAVPNSYEAVRKLNVMMHRLQLIHCQILEEKTLCSALEICGDGPHVGSHTVEADLQPMGPCDKVTQVTGRDRNSFIDVTLITHMLESYERCHQAVLQDLRRHLKLMGSMIHHQESEDDTASEPSLPSLPAAAASASDVAPRARTWWKRLICIA